MIVFLWIFLKKDKGNAKEQPQLNQSRPKKEALFFLVYAISSSSWNFGAS